MPNLEQSVATLDRQRRPFIITKLEAAALYEALVLLSVAAARSKHPDRLPYNVQSVDALKDRVLDDAWPELKGIYRGNRARRRKVTP